MKKLVAFAIVLTVLISGWLIYSKAKKDEREAEYQAAMAPFKRDLPVGTSRVDAEQYLNSRHIKYDRVRVGGEEADRFQIQIATEPGGIVCGERRVYVAMDFTAQDKLKEIRVTKWSTCV